MREDEMKDRVKRTLEARSGAFGALIAGDGLFTEKHQMTYYLTSQPNSDPETLREFRLSLAAREDLAEIKHAPGHPFAEPDEDAYEGPAELQDAFTELAEEFGYTLWT